MGEAEQDSAIWLLCHFSHVVKLNLYQPFSLSLTHLFFLSSHFITYPPAIISLSPQLPTSSFPTASISLQRGTKRGRKALISPHRWSPQPPHPSQSWWDYDAARGFAGLQLPQTEQGLFCMCAWGSGWLRMLAASSSQSPPCPWQQIAGAAWER